MVVISDGGIPSSPGFTTGKTGALVTGGGREIGGKVLDGISGKCGTSSSVMVGVGASFGESRGLTSDLISGGVI